MKAVLIKQVRH